jgi:beta-N-acetylhexosaminidase
MEAILPRDWTAREEVLERFLLGFAGTSLPDWLAHLLSAGLAGVAIYPRNYANPEELRALTEAIRTAAGRPVLIGIDQEGGTRFALPPPFTQWPSPTELGRLDAADSGEVDSGHMEVRSDVHFNTGEYFTVRIARAIARELRGVGINLDFAPMLDLATNPDSPVTADRSFGSDPGRVAAFGTSFLRGLADEGVFGCAKHFPGHGDGAIDPHFDLPSFAGTAERLAQHELVPFAAAIEAGAELVMTAHILLSRIDPNRPASLSQRVIEGLLRRELHFDGVILADDLGMGAISRRYGHAESVVKTLEAGTDIAMLCHNDAAVPVAIEAVAESAEGGRFDPAQWAAGRARIARLRAKISATEKVALPLEVIGCEEHLRLAAEVRERLAQARAGTPGG